MCKSSSPVEVDEKVQSILAFQRSFESQYTKSGDESKAIDRWTTKTLWVDRLHKRSYKERARLRKFILGQDLV
ncbi:hypothetical protein TNCV_1925631 [Trichonephila clavipes]|nr:hypothetical protein TNCV_1925631 [Trichonephila clavipes]